MTGAPNTESIHTPVLTKEILNNLRCTSGGRFIDGTANGGGHTTAIAKAVGESGKVLSIEWDQTVAEHLRQRLVDEGIEKTVVIRQGNFKEIERFADEEGMRDCDGALFDLGYSSFHVDRSGRGFTFRKSEPLDMRYAPSSGISAQEVLARFPERDIANILKVYGEERFAERIARHIVAERGRHAIVTTFDLVKIVEEAVPAGYRRGRINCATKTFQALRIFVNDELENVRVALERTYKVLKPGGRVAVISFHSLEDRIVKSFGRDKEANGLMTVVTKKPIVPSVRERKENHRSRSAKLRIFEKVH